MAWIHDRYAYNNRLQLGYNEYLRPLAMGTEWQGIRIGIRYAVLDAGRTNIGNWGLVVGVCRGVTGGVQSSASEWIGGGIFGAALPTYGNAGGGAATNFTAATPNYWTTGNTPNVAYKSNTTATYAAATGASHFITATNQGGAWGGQVMGQIFVDIQKGSPNYSFQVWYTDTFGKAQTNVTDAVFMSNLEFFTSTNITGGGGKTLAYSGAGLFDTLSVAHYRAWPPVEIDMIGVCRYY